jgi:hypothetical protein
VIYQVWDGSISQWVDDRKEEYSYDTNENTTTEIDSYWSNAQWIPSEKWEYTYDTNQNLATLINSEWINNQWVLIGKIEYTFDATNNMTTLLIYEWNNNQWLLAAKLENNYDDNGNLTVETGFLLDTGNWVAYVKYEHTYINNNRTNLTAYEWNFITSQWDYDWIDEYTYDANDNLITEIDSYWEINQWIAYDKFEYTYDLNGNTIREIKFVWNNNVSQWEEFWKYEYTFDLNYDSSDLIVPSWYYDSYDYTYNNMVIAESYYDFINPNWVETEKIILNYSDYDSTLNIEDERLAQSVNLYPNPVSDNLTIDSEISLTKVEIYSILGKKVKEINSDFKSILTDNLSNGVYILRIHSEKGYTTEKLIKN